MKVMIHQSFFMPNGVNSLKKFHFFNLIRNFIFQALKIFKEIAERFNQQQYIYFGIIEGTKNEIAGIQLDKFPKIKFFLRNRKKDPFDFKGKISENEILKFIFQYSTY